VVFEKEGETSSLPARTVVLAIGVEPVNELYEEFKDQVEEIYLIGDARKPVRLWRPCGRVGSGAEI